MGAMREYMIRAADLFAQAHAGFSAGNALSTLPDSFGRDMARQAYQLANVRLSEGVAMLEQTGMAPLTAQRVGSLVALERMTIEDAITAVESVRDVPCQGSDPIERTADMPEGEASPFKFASCTATASYVVEVKNRFGKVVGAFNVCARHAQSTPKGTVRPL